MKADALNLGHGLSFDDLYDRAGLVRLDGLFRRALGAAGGDLRPRPVQGALAGRMPRMNGAE